MCCDLEPEADSVLLQLVSTAHLSHLQLAVLHTAAGPGEVHVEVHAVDTGARVVLDAQVNVLLSAESENVSTNDDFVVSCNASTSANKDPS